MEFKTGMTVDDSAGILNSMGVCGFSPFFILNGQLVCFLSSKGYTWDIASGVSLGLVVKENTLYRVKITWDGNEYVWYIWNGSAWRKLKGIINTMPVFGSDIQFGTGKVLNFPFSGAIDMNKCYICIGGKLFWEGEKGAYRNANR